jgi:cytochrome c peroxidase
MNKSKWMGPTHAMIIVLAMVTAGKVSLAAESESGPHGGIDPVAWATIYMLQGNELTADRIALGRKLYFDTRLSKDGTLACATCHDVSRGFTDHRSVSEGIGDHLGKRSAPTDECGAPAKPVLGRACTLPRGTGKAADLEPNRDGTSGRGQRHGGRQHRSGLCGTLSEGVRTRPNYEDLGRAIASFERTLIFLDAPFDRLPPATPRPFRPRHSGALSSSTARRAA